jgi:signal transduction histidine kinase
MQILDALAGPFTGDAMALYRLALQGRVRRPAALGPLADHLLQQAGLDHAAAGRALVVGAWAQIASGQREAAGHSAAMAQARLDRCDDPGAQALGLDLAAQLANTGGQYSEAVRLGLAVMAVPEALRLPAEWVATMVRLASAYERLGQFDEALRWHYRALAVVADAHDPVAHALVLAGAGGLQLSLLNMEDAASLCEAAWALMRDQPHGLAWGTSAMNWLMVLRLQQRYAQALPLAHLIHAADPALGAPNRYKRLLLLAEVFWYAGHVAPVQALLDEGLALYAFGADPPGEWVRLQARLWLADGQPARALQACRARLGQVDDQADGNDSTYDVVQWHSMAAEALQALGDFQGALQSQRDAGAAERRLAGAATRARRLTLQIQYELENIRRERDASLQREQAAAQEQARLAQLNQQLEEASLAKSRFLAAASHDLRQPLHALGLQLAHLRSGVDDAEREVVEQRMGRALGALTTLFDALLDLSRMDAGVVAPRRQTVALTPLLLRLADELAPVAQARGLRLALHLSGPRCTDSDPALLETMLRNLLGNALKYTRRGGVLLALRDQGEHLWLQVWDSGVGIGPQERERVFEEFYQIDGAASGPAEGLGLGLSIVKRLSQLLDHPLRLDSRLGLGSRFGIRVPRRDHPAPQAPAAPAQLAPAGAQRALRIAVIEDDALVSESLVALLQRWGHQVLAADSAQALLQAQGPGLLLDAVIADHRLRSDATGDAEVARLRQALGQAVPALIVTGDTSPAHLRALAGSGLPWLSKPVQPLRLRGWLMGLSAPG